MAEKIAVYSFKKYNISDDSNDVRTVKGTREAIKRIESTPIEGTEEMIDPALLDGSGFYRGQK